MSSVLTLTDLFGTELGDLQDQHDWNVHLHCDDHQYSAGALGIFPDPGWRFSLRLHHWDDFLDGFDAEPMFGAAVEWVFAVKEELQAFTSYRTSYGVECHPAADRDSQHPYGIGKRAWYEDEYRKDVFGTAWRFIFCACDRLDIPCWFDSHTFRFDFSLSTEDATQFKMMLGAWPFNTRIPAEWPTKGFNRDEPPVLARAVSDGATPTPIFGRDY